MVAEPPKTPLTSVAFFSDSMQVCVAAGVSVSLGEGVVMGASVALF